MLKIIRQTIDKFALLKKGEAVVVSVSGGPDSTSLLFALNSLKKEFNIELYCAHFNHRIRGRESDQDEEYVRNLARRLRIPFAAESKDTKAFAKKNKFSLEQAARELRYDFLLRTAKGMGADKIATGHTRDDQAETLLMRLLRGSGLRGLRAIPPARRLSSKITVIRPFIDTSRKDINAYLKTKKIKARLDSSNTKTVFLRNRLRNKLIPHIEQYYSKQFKDILARTASVMSADYEYLLKQQTNAFKRIASFKKDKCVSIPLKSFNSLDLSLKMGIVRLAIKSIKGDLRSIDYKHWEGIEKLILKGKVNSLVHLPGGLCVRRRANSIVFEIRGVKTIKDKLPVSFLIKVPGKTKIIDKLSMVSSVLKGRGRGFSGSRNIECFDSDKIAFPLTARSRMPHDRIRPLGMKKYKRIKQIFIDEKIKARRRPKVPIIIDATGKILWVCGIRMSEDFKITPATKRTLKLTIAS